MADKNLSASRETKPNHGFYGSERVDDDVKEKRKEKEGRGEEIKDYMQPFAFILET